MATRKQKLKVSIFLIVCIGLMTAGTLVITGIYQEPGQHYWLEFDESVLGLYEGSMVEYLGVPVGKVREIHVTEEKLAHVAIVINPNKVSLREGVEGRLVIYSIAAGTMAVSLSGGSPDNPLLTEHSKIPTKPSTIEAFSSQMTTILEDVTAISGSIRGQIEHLDEKAISDIVHQVRDLLNKGDGFVENTDTLILEATEVVKDVRKHAETLVAHIDARSRDLERLTQKIERLVETYTQKGEELEVDVLQQQFNELLEQINHAAKQLDSTVVNIELVATDIVHKAGNVEYSLRGTMLELNDAFESIRILVNQLKEDPSSLIRGRGRVRE